MKLNHISLMAVTLLPLPLAAATGDLYVSYGQSSGAVSGYTGGVANGVTYSAALSYPAGLAFDSFGNLYVANYGNNTIYQYTPATPGGVRSTVISVNQPTTLAFNNAGTLYYANYSSGFGSVYVLGSSTPLFSIGLGANDYDMGLACNSAGVLFASYGDGLYQIAPNGIPSPFIAGLSGSSGFVTAQSLAFDANDNLYIALIDTRSGSSIQVCDPGGNLTPFTSLSGITISALAFDDDGNLFVASVNTGEVLEFKNNGGILDATPTTYLSGLNSPAGLAFVPPAPVPEPSVLALLAVSGAAWLGFRRRKKH